MAEEKKEEEQKAPEGPGLLSKILNYGFLVLAAAGIGGGLALAYMGTIGANSTQMDEEYFKPILERERETRAEHPILFSMEPFTVNLKDSSPRRIIRAQVSFGMLTGEGFEEVVLKEPKARDAVVRILQDKMYKEIQPIQGKLYLKDQIAQEVNRILAKGVVKEVYFSELVVQ